MWRGLPRKLYTHLRNSVHGKWDISAQQKCLWITRIWMYMSYFSYYQLPPTKVICLLWRQFFRVMFCPFSIQINWSVVSRIVAMLVAADRSNSASMAPLSIATMHNTILQLIWIENGRNIAQNNCLQGKQIALVGIYLLSLWSVCSSDVYRHESGRWCSLYHFASPGFPFILIFSC